MSSLASIGETPRQSWSARPRPRAAGRGRGHSDAGARRRRAHEGRRGFAPRRRLAPRRRPGRRGRRPPPARLVVGGALDDDGGVSPLGTRRRVPVRRPVQVRARLAEHRAPPPASPPRPPDGRSRAYERNRRVRKRGKCGHLRRFLLERFGADALRSGPVLDVGGGKGELAFELENLNDVRTVVVDAAPLRLAKLEKKLRGGWFHRGTWAEPRPVAEETEKNRLPRGSPGDEDAKPTREPPERGIRRPAHWRVLWSPELWREVRLPDDARRRPAEGEGEDASSAAATAAAAASADAAARAALHRHWAAAATVRFRAAGEHAEDGRTRGGVSAALRSLSKPGGGAAASGDIFERRERREGDDSDSRSGSDSGSDSSAATTARARCECGDAPECGAYPPDLGLVRAALERCSAVVGMHSDHATEWIVDFALERRKRFAVVPCCVCPESFPTRRGPGGGGAVRTHDAFVEYLVAKGAEGEIATGTLGFDGKNVVVYSTYDVVDDVEEGSG